MSAHVPTIEQMASALGQAFPDTVFETIQLDEDADGNGGLTIGWNSDEFHVIPAGTKVGEYILMEPYFPQDNGGGKYRYEPKFSDPAALLDKTPFIFNTKDTEGDDLALFTFPFTGLAGTIIQKLEDSINELIGGWTCNVGTGINASISVNFDGDTLKSAASKIAQACGCTLHYTWKQINFGTRQVYGGTEFYNRFIVFGGTTNMSRRIASGQYTSVVKRLTLDETLYPGSIIDKSAPGGTPMTKLLVFDDIYPKMELFIADVHERRCYLIDENGEKIPDGGYETDGSGSYILDEDGEKIPTYKQYSKWYVKLRYADGTQFTLNDDIILVGQTLKLLFQPNYDIFSGGTPQADETSPLAGRSFEVAYFDTATHEYEADDVNSEGYTAQAGWFRIIFTAEGETIIPTTSDLQLTPRIGNKVTLINVALSGQYTDIAKQQLLAAANAAIGDYDKVGLGGKAVAYPSDGEWPAQVSGVKAPLPDVGDLYQGLFVSSKSTDLITGREEITYGTFGERSLINSMIDKIDNAQTSGGGGTTKGNNFESGQNTQNSQNWRTLQLAGGNLGVKSVTQYINNQVNGLVQDVEAVQEQVDQKIDMWFCAGEPFPNEYSPNATPNEPVSKWDDYEVHDQDLYYDTRHVPAVQGSRAWRWENRDGRWLWYEVFDAQTIDALEKIFDVSSDGVLSPGAEKTRVLIEWLKCVQEYKKYTEQGEDYGITTELTAYVNAFKALGKLLNDDVDLVDDSISTIPTPAWLSDLETETTIPSPNDYRAKWKNYYDTLTALLQAITNKAKALADAAQSDASAALTLIGNMGDDSLLDPSEKLTVKREFIACYHEMMDTEKEGYASGILDMAKDANNHWIISYDKYIQPYYDAFLALGQYLDGSEQWQFPVLADFDDAALPSWIQEENMGNTNTIDGDVWRGLWADFYTNRTAVLTALSEAAHNAADNAQQKADDAQAEIDKIVDDCIITVGSEKARLLAEWKEVVAKYNVLKSLENVYPDQFQNYKNAIRSLASMLHGMSNGSLVSISTLNGFLSGEDLPDWLGTYFDLDIDITDSIYGGYTAEDYREIWTEYFSKLEALTNSKVSVFVKPSTNPPQPPYKNGDMWIVTDEDNKTLICINGRTSGSYVAADWKEMSAEKDYRMLLAVMVEQCYLYNNKILPSGWHHFSVYLTTDTTTPSTLSDKRAGSILFMPNASQSSKRIQYYYYSQWNEVSDEGLYDALNGVYEAIVEATEGTVTFNVYSSKTNAGNNPQENSLVARELTYSDPVTNEDIKGGLDVLYYNGSTWELLSKATSAAIENLGNAVRMVVFGNEDFGDGSSGTFGSGAAFQKAMGMIFSELYDSETGERIAGAYIATYVKQGTGSNEKNVLSGVWISADNVDFEAQNFTIDARKIYVKSGTSLFSLFNGDAKLKASNIVFAGETFKIDAGKINFDGQEVDLTSSNLSLDADQITFGGHEIQIGAQESLIFTCKGSGNSQGVIDFSGAKVNMSADQIKFTGLTIINGKFSVDENGNVTMDGFTATNANITGTITAEDGEIGGFEIGTDTLRNTNYGASIEIANAASNPTQRTIIGKAAVDTFTNRECSMVAENKESGQTYNTALFLNAENATYNYAFHGNGNGVLNGLMFGYKTQNKAVTMKDQSLGSISLTDGATILVTGSYGGNHTITLPQLSNVRKCLGISNVLTPFSIEVEIINLTSGNLNMRFRGYEGYSSSEYPYLMSNNGGTESGGAAITTITPGGYVKMRLIYVNDGKSYRAHRLVYNHE